MKRATLVAAAALGLGTFGASAEIYSFDGTGAVGGFVDGFDGADSFPFTGLGVGSAISFRFEFDADAAAIADNGSLAIYEFTGGGSFFQMGGNMTSFDTVRITVSTTGFIGFYGENEALGFSANADLNVGVLDSTDLLRSFDLASSGGFGSLNANSSANQSLLPIMMGPMQSGTITPTPGTGALVFGGLLMATRRRR